MDANRTYLLAQNGVRGEHIDCTPPPLLRQHLPADPASTMQRRNSLDSIDSIAREKVEAHTASAPRSDVRSALAKVARRLSGAGREKQLIAGQATVASGRVHEHEPFQVKANEKKREEVMNDEMGRVKIAKER
ncbi:hypothetical protein E8E11_000611 [Didymella keratinophila]|nr:hypothetical protein E8E11_000611 [Didymella keratinophila]